MIGLLGIPPIGDWNWVAIGTLALAAATFYLALSNRKIVRTSQDQLETSQRDLEQAIEQNRTSRLALEAQTAPVLSSVPWGLEQKPTRFDIRTGRGENFEDASRIKTRQEVVSDEPRVRVEVPFRNVGNGVATITAVNVMIGGLTFPGRADNPIVPPGEIAHAELDAGRIDEAFERALSLDSEGVTFSVVIAYADAAWTDRGAICLDLHRDQPGTPAWRVRQLHLGETAEDALSRPRVSSIPR